MIGSKDSRLVAFLSLMMLVAVNVNAYAQQQFEAVVMNAVENQMRAYPKSELRDLYKNFFQDKFGPGHIVGDTVSAGRYLRSELAEAKTFSGAYAEPTGYEGNYYRANLSLIKEDIIDYATFFDAFVRSVKNLNFMSVDEWSKEWGRIEAVIESMRLSLPHFDEDKTEIRDMLNKGEYVMHHSKAFEQEYDPHYRIIRKDIYEKELLPLIDKILKGK